MTPVAETIAITDLDRLSINSATEQSVLEVPNAESVAL